MVSGEIDHRSVKSRGETVPYAAFILADGDELLRARRADFFAQRANPLDESLLREEKIIVNAKRIVADIHAARTKFEFTGKGNAASDRIRRRIPCGRQRRAVGITFRKPLIPRGQFDGIAVRTRLPQVLRNAGLVNEVPSQKRNIMEARDDRGNERLLLAERLGTKVGVYSTEYIGEKSEEIELYGQAVLACGHQISFESAERAFVRLAVFIAELVPAGPPTGAQHIQAGGLYLRHVAVPDVNVGMIEIKALHFA